MCKCVQRVETFFHFGMYGMEWNRTGRGFKEEEGKNQKIICLSICYYSWCLFLCLRHPKLDIYDGYDE